MKKLSLLFLVVLTVGAFTVLLQSCDDTKTYAEMLEDERRALNAFLTKHNIKTITKEEFEKDTITNVAENEYVLFSNGTYLQIEDRGDGEIPKSRDEIILRMVEYNIMAETNENVTDTLSNVHVDNLTDSFYYNPNASTTRFIYDSFNGYFPHIYYQFFSVASPTLDVPRGIINILPYIKNGARVKVIVPSKLGHSHGMQYVYPYYYDIRKIQIR